MLESHDTFSIVEEQLQVAVKTIESDLVRISKRVLENEEVVAPVLTREEVDITRVSINQVVDQAAPIRHEGDVMIVPVYEEVLVVTKQLVLKEELHITRRSVNEPAPAQIIKLRREDVTVSRIPAAPNT